MENATNSTEKQCREALNTGLTQFKQALTEYDPHNEEGFASLISYGQRYFGFLLNDIAKEAGMHPTAVSRWASNIHVPPLGTRMLVRDYMIKNIDQRL